MLTLVFGIVAALALPGEASVVTRALSGWNVAVWSYLFLMAWLMMRADKHAVRKMAQQEDESAVAVLVLLSLAAALSLLANIHELSGMAGASSELRVMKYLFAASTVLGSWLLLGVIFCFHYALLFYNSAPDKPALRFPEDEDMPDFWDFLYFSFTIAVAAQTSDVTVMNRQVRKTVLAQSILSFFFNVAVVGFSINIAAGLVGN
ncbi:DUF1345 domain-containing protein [Undibacterium umbellatum]|uniref:DUF1345 domain-containing protein n=1 Tax=Undibacterium umbellatum TaxID=2762300 RepID=UPI002E31DF45|nr:DUF1345 domain-containing protein [Undibacterium umbellatum]